MQILPLIQRSSQSAASDAATIGSAGLGSRQSALFASILDSARTTAASTADQTKASSYGTTNEDTSRVDVAEAAAPHMSAETDPPEAAPSLVFFAAVAATVNKFVGPHCPFLFDISNHAGSDISKH